MPLQQEPEVDSREALVDELAGMFDQKPKERRLTGLDRSQEAEFQRWYAPRAKKLDLDPNPDDPEHHYDWRAAWKAGAEANAEGHWPSEFKLEGHPRRFIGGADTMKGEEPPKRNPLRMDQTKEQRAVGERAKQKLAREIDDLFPARESTAGQKVSIGATESVADIAKAPELALKGAEQLARKLGVPVDTIERHFPEIKLAGRAVKRLADYGRGLHQAAREAEPFPSGDFGSQALRGLGSTAPFAVAGPLGGELLVGLVGGAQGAVPLFEDVLAETGDEKKAWIGAAAGFGLGLTEMAGVGGILSDLDRASAGTFKKALLRTAAESSEEGLQEWFQAGGQDIVQKALTGKQIKLLQTLEAQGQAGAIGALLGAAVSGGSEVLGHGLGRLPGQPQQAPGSQGELTPLDVFAEDVKGALALQQPPGSRLGKARTVGDIGPETAPKPKKAKEPKTEDEAAQAIAAGQPLELEQLQKFPGAVAKAAEIVHAPPEPAQPTTPATPRLAPGEAEKPATAETAPTKKADQEPAGSAGEAGVTYATTGEPAENSSVQPGDKLGPVEAIPIEDLREFNAGKKVDEGKVAEIAQAMREGKPLGVVIAHEEPDGSLVIDDGSTRIAAAKRLGHTHVPVRIVEPKAAEAATSPPKAEAKAPKHEPIDLQTGKNFKVRIMHEGQRVGSVLGSVMEKTVNVAATRIAPEHKGKGLVSSAYERLAEQTIASGRELWSDNVVSEDAAKLYEALERKGFVVVKSTEARRVEKPPGEQSEMGPAWYAQGPVFRVTGKTGHVREATKKVGEPATGLHSEERRKGEAHKSFTPENIRATLGVDEEQAAALDALATALGLDKAKLRLVKGGKAGAGALLQRKGPKEVPFSRFRALGWLWSKGVAADPTAPIETLRAMVAKERERRGELVGSLRGQLDEQMAAGIEEDPLLQDGKGSVEFLASGEALIRALAAADVSTGVHEIAHVARRWLLERSVPAENRPGITDHEIEVAEEWAGVEQGKWTTEAEEKFARGFERYLHDGTAPNVGLRSLFAKLKAWLGKVYETLKGSALDLEISAPMRTVYDKLVTRGVGEETKLRTKEDEERPIPNREATEEIAVGPYGIDTGEMLARDDGLLSAVQAWVRGTKAGATQADRDALAAAFTERPETLRRFREALRRKWGARLTLYRGDSREPSDVTSWTLSKREAEKWAAMRSDGGPGRVHSVEVSPDDVLGFGSSVEGEVLARASLAKGLHSEEAKAKREAQKPTPAVEEPATQAELMRQAKVEQAAAREEIGNGPDANQRAIEANRRVEALEQNERVARGERMTGPAATDAPDAPDLPFRVNPNDIPIDLANRAHQGTSWTPERRGYLHQNDYIEAMRSTWATFEPKAKTPEQRASLIAEMERFRDGYIQREKARLHAMSRTISSMVTGPSNFPSRRAEKLNGFAENRLNELIDFVKRARAAIGRALETERIQAAGGEIEVAKQRLATLEKLQEAMKKANGVLRKQGLTDEQRIEQLRELGLREEVARKALTPNYLGKIGIEPWQLTSNLANIKRLRERIATLEKRDVRALRHVDFDGGKVELDPKDDRLRIIFDRKPQADMLRQLRANGFKWSPTAGAWQRQWTPNAELATERLLGVKLAGEEARAIEEHGKELAAEAGARKVSSANAVNADAARELLRSEINNADLVGAQRADRIDNLRQLIAFHEAGGAREGTAVRNGDEIAYTGVVKDDGAREFIYLEGAKVGAYGVTYKEPDAKPKHGAYKGYLVKQASTSGPRDTFIEKDGQLIGWANDVADARRIIDELAVKPSESIPDELYAFPGSIMPDVKAALDAIAKRLGYIRNQAVTVGGVLPTQTWTERAITRWQDTFRSGKTTVQEIKKAGGAVTDATDYYLQEELRRKRTGHRLDKFASEHQRPILVGLRNGGISPEEAGEALNAREAREVNELIRQRDPDNDAGSGMTDAEADAIMARIRSGKRAAAFADFFRRFDAATKEIREGWVRDGRKSRGEVDTLEHTRPNYAPLRSDLDEETPVRATRGHGQGVDVRGQPFRQATGRHTRADAAKILAYAFTQAEQSIVTGEKIRVMRSFANLVRANLTLPGMADIFKINPAQTHPAVVNGLVRQVYDPTFRLADNVVAFWENGQQFWIEIDTAYQNIATALKNLGSDSLGKALGLVRAVMNYIRAVNIQYNPAFPLFNAIKDAAGAFINSNEHGLAFATRTVRDVPQALYALTRQKLGRPATGLGSNWARKVERYQASGAPVAYIDTLGFDEQIKAIQRSSKHAARQGAIGSTLRGWRMMLDAIKAANEIVEQGVRFSAFVHAQEDLGMTEERAASWSKNLTVNFERKGDYGATMNALYLFSNAGIQATARVGQALGHPGVKRLLVSAVVGLMGWDLLMRAIGGKDADGEDCWDKVPSYVKRHNFVIMHAGSEGACGGYVTIPTPFVYDWFQTLAFQLSGVASGNVTPGAALGETLSAAFEAFDPIGSGQLDLGDPASIARTAAPTILDPLVELATNRDWKGDPIAYNEFAKVDSAVKFPEPSSAGKGVAEWLNKAAGGDEFARGPGKLGELLDISPQTLDHLAGWLTGGLGRSLARMYEAGHTNDGNVPDMLAAPFKQRLLKEPSRFASASDFRNLQDAISAERDRAIRDKRLLSRELGSVWKESNQIEQYRQRQRKEIDKLEGQARKVAERELDKTIQSWNARARKVLLTTQ